MKIRKREEIQETFALNLEKERIRLDMTQADFAKMLDISLSTYRNIIDGNVKKIDLYQIYLICLHADKYLFELLESDYKYEYRIIKKLRELSKPQLDFIESIVDFEVQLSGMKECMQNEATSITVLSPIGIERDEMIWDSCVPKSIDIGENFYKFQGKFHCAIEITSHAFRPAYNKGDILLVRKRPPINDEVAIFINRNTHRAYLRKYVIWKHIELQPINNYGETIYIGHDDIIESDEWFCFGVVITKIR